MRIKENFALSQVANVWVVLPLGEATVNFNGMLRLNDSGAMLWHLLEQGSSREALAQVLTEKFDVTEEQALTDVDEFISTLTKAGCIDLQ